MTPAIGIFGGSFNPVHNGHIELARRLLTLAGLDEVWFVVSPQNPFKRNEKLLDDALRLEMVRIALADEPRMASSACHGLPICGIRFSRLPRIIPAASSSC